MVGLSLIKGAAALYTPSYERGADILVSDTVVALGSELGGDTEALVLRLSGDASIVDAAGCVAIPGLVDMHVHVCGGGGEAGVPLPVNQCCVLLYYYTPWLAGPCRARQCPACRCACRLSI